MGHGPDASHSQGHDGHDGGVLNAPVTITVGLPEGDYVTFGLEVPRDEGSGPAGTPLVTEVEVAVAELRGALWVQIAADTACVTFGSRCSGFSDRCMTRLGWTPLTGASTFSWQPTTV